MRFNEFEGNEVWYISYGGFRNGGWRFLFEFLKPKPFCHELKLVLNLFIYLFFSKNDCNCKTQWWHKVFGKSLFHFSCLIFLTFLEHSIVHQIKLSLAYFILDRIFCFTCFIGVDTGTIVLNIFIIFIFLNLNSIVFASYVDNVIRWL